VSSPVEGLDKVVAALGGVTDTLAANVKPALRLAAKDLFDQSQVLVPVEKGDLKATGKINSGGRGFSSWTTVSYGGESPQGKDVDYALFVHEDLEKYHEPPTQARYLADALLQVRDTMKAKIGRSLRVGLR
jgi:hypothetical protein